MPQHRQVTSFWHALRKCSTVVTISATALWMIISESATSNRPCGSAARAEGLRCGHSWRFGSLHTSM